MMNDNAISNILIDVDFLEDILKQIGRSHLSSVFSELRLVSNWHILLPRAHPLGGIERNRTRTDLIDRRPPFL